MEENIQYFQVDSEGVVWAEDIWPSGDGRDPEFFRDSLA